MKSTEIKFTAIPSTEEVKAELKWRRERKYIIILQLIH